MLDQIIGSMKYRIWIYGYGWIPYMERYTTMIRKKRKVNLFPDSPRYTTIYS